MDAVDKIKNIPFDKDINFLIYGDAITHIILNKWALSTPISNIYKGLNLNKEPNPSLNYYIDNGDIRMSPFDSTIYTGFDYCFLFYDGITRKKKDTDIIKKWISQRDRFLQSQHKSRKCRATILFVLGNAKIDEDFKDIRKIHVQIDNIDKEEFKMLPYKMAEKIYNERLEEFNRCAQLILSS